MDKQIYLKARGITKTFGQTKALSNVSMDFYTGEIRGLIGENGSGKSTLCNVIAGTLQADSGSLYVQENTYHPKTPLDAQAHKIAMITQEMGTIGKISVAANIFLGKEDQFRKGLLIDTKAMAEAAGNLLKQLDLGEIDPMAMTETLPFEDRKMVEIAKAMYIDPVVLIVDETTTALSLKGRDLLYRLMLKHRDAGKSVIFISHDLDEMTTYCDSLTVMRDGEVVDTVSTKGITHKQIRELMVGRTINENFYRKDYEPHVSGKPVLNVENLTYKDIVKGISFTLHAGEILGFGGLTDCGMHELGKVLFGAEPSDAGRVTLIQENTEQEIKTPGAAIRGKIAYLSKDRDQEALMLGASIQDNICAPSLDLIKHKAMVLPKAESAMANQYASRMKVKMQDVTQRCSALSGGNKQKVVIAKWLANGSRIFIMDCPTRGIDVGVKADIYRMMEKLTAEGAAIIMISDELPELIGMCDRLIVMKSGQISHTFQREEGLNEKQIIHYVV